MVWYDWSDYVAVQLGGLLPFFILGLMQLSSWIRQSNAMQFCVSVAEKLEIWVYTHGGDNTIVACRGTELKEFVGLQ